MSKIEEEAARWFARMRGAAPDHPERGRFEAWLTASPAHAAEYNAFIDTWRDLQSGARGEELALAMRERQERQFQARRRMLAHGVAGLVLAGAGGGWYFGYRQPVWQFARETGVGETARAVLDDGSVATLNAGTRLAVVYTRATRRVELFDGEAIFEVEPGERPFVVASGSMRVTVLGTRFGVNLLSRKNRVSVERGRVLVETGPFWRRRRETLQAGQVAEVALLADGEAAPPEIVARKASDGFAFERGMIAFDDADLQEIAETLSRYSRQPVRVRPASPGAPSPRIVAGIQTTDVDDFIDLLPRFAPIVVRREAGAVWLHARGKRQ